MTVFDLLFIVLFLAMIATLIVAVVLASRGRRARALALLRRLAICALTYIGIVYAATAFSKQVVLRVGDPQCFDDWCLVVEHTERTPQDARTRYDIALKIFSRARRVAQRENGAKDVYLVDANWTRYDPVPNNSELPLNTLLQARESVTTHRSFQLPADDHDVGLVLDHSSFPFCMIIGECGAFHKGTIVRID